MYDQEFDEFWDKSELPFKTPKDFAYVIWQAAKAPKHIQLEGGPYTIVQRDGLIVAGLSRKTFDQAKKAGDMITRRNRLAAFVYEHCGYEGEWKEGVCNSYIYLYGETHKYNIEESFPDLCKQYMPEATAIWLCEKLNSGEIVL